MDLLSCFIHLTVTVTPSQLSLSKKSHLFLSLGFHHRPYISPPFPQQGTYFKIFIFIHNSSFFVHLFFFFFVHCTLIALLSQLLKMEATRAALNLTATVLPSSSRPSKPSMFVGRSTVSLFRSNLPFSCKVSNCCFDFFFFKF